MTKRKSLIAAFAFLLVLSFATVCGIALSRGTFTARAAEAASYVTVNSQELYSGQYLESNDATVKSTGATTEPATYVAWYNGGVLTLNGYNGGQISFGGDLTIKLKDKNTITESSQGIFASNCENLIIDADSEATLNINVLSSANEVYGISVGQGGVATTGSVTIKGKATVNINAETSVNHAYGIYTKTGFNIVGSANLNIKNTSSNSTSTMSYSMVSSNNKPLFDTDGVVTLDNSECANRNYCIGAYGIDMKKGTLICRYKPGNRYSYACSQTISTAPEGCVLRENPYGLGETVIQSGVGYIVTVENGLDYYDKHSNQYVADETVRIKTTIEELPFKGWEGEGVVFENASQKETTFTMVGKNVTVRAVYDVFAKQPVFERIGENKGSLSVRLKKQTSGYQPIVLINSVGDVNTTCYFSQDAVSENYTYKCSSFSTFYVPAGTYKIRVEYNGYYFYSEPFEIDYTDKTPFAEVSDVTVTGKRRREITPASFVVTLSNATFKKIAEGTDVSSWFNYITDGLVAKISAVSEGATSATITICGTPNATASRTFALNIPQDVLATGNDSVIATEYNSNARFNIVNPASYKVTITDGKAQVGDKTQTNIEEGLTVKIIAGDKEGYVFEKWVVVSGDVALDDENSATTTFSMPESNVEIKATYKKLSHVHSYKPVVETPATCVAEGMKKHFVCEGCDKLFDADKNETTEDALKIAINPNAHNLETEWTATSDGHYHRCKNGCAAGHDEIKSHTPDRAAATETDPVKCTECGYIISPITGHVHRLTKVSGTEATCTEYGRKTYYVCVGCELKFKDEAGTEEITDESVLIIPKAHKFGEWIEEVPATAEATGFKAHKTCEFCHKNFDKDDNEIEDLTLYKTFYVILSQGTLQADGETSASTGQGAARLDVKEGTVVTIIAQERSDAVFVKWTYSAVVEVKFENANSAKTTFVMPKGDVWLECEYKLIRSVTVENGVLEGGATSGKYKEGEIVKIIAEATLGGKEFVKWVVVSGEVSLADENSAKTTFVMPKGDVKITALYKSEHTLVLVEEKPATCTETGMRRYYVCEECGRKFTDETETEEITDDSVLIIPMAHKFGEWIEEVPATAETTGIKAHKTCEFCHKNFDKDENEIEDLTLYKTYYVILPQGTLQADGETSASTGQGAAQLDVKEGTVVTIIAQEKSDAVFVKWTYSAVVEVIFENENSAKTTFVMPKGDVWLECEYKAARNVTVKNGTGGGKIEVGQTVTITADAAPEGKEFDKWIVISGEVTLDNENSATTTFVMPDGAVEIEATYKDKTSGGESVPEGSISGGAIAGIVIGSVVVVGIGGFAIFWFAIKKKTFAELIAAIKGLFKKK